MEIYVKKHFYFLTYFFFWFLIIILSFIYMYIDFYPCRSFNDSNWWRHKLGHT